jgi:chemotaxis protein MotB
MKLPGKKHAEHENHERWLVSYADFITLLFAFFVVMYASSTNNPAKMQLIEDSIKSQMNLDGSGGSPTFTFHKQDTKNLVKNPARAVQKAPIEDMAGAVGDPTLEAIKTEMQKNKQAQEYAEQRRLDKNLAILNEGLKSEIEERKIVIMTEGKDIIIYIDSKNTFDPGLPHIKPTFNETAERLATVLDSVTGRLRVSAYTEADRIPASAKVENHLELTTARASRFSNLLINNSKTLEERIGVESFGATRPINKSSSPYQSITNSRIEITVYQK